MRNLILAILLLLYFPTYVYGKIKNKKIFKDIEIQESLETHIAEFNQLKSTYG